jgi:hypothetical protein
MTDFSEATLDSILSTVETLKAVNTFSLVNPLPHLCPSRNLQNIVFSENGNRNK